VGYLSGVLDPFPRIVAPGPVLRVTFGGTTRNVQLANVPGTLEEAAIELQAALRAGGPQAFTTAAVALARRRLLVVPGGFVGAPPAVVIAGVAGTDLTTVRELRFRGTLAVRVRVNGAESIDLVTVDLP
jgi:hypothetical protein